MENLENKNENDISKEIKGWVLNKGVGESVLHKASRLDYVVSWGWFGIDLMRGGIHWENAKKKLKCEECF